MEGLKKNTIATIGKNEGCKVTVVYAGGNGLQDAYRILAKIAIERMERQENEKSSNIPQG